MELVNVNTKVPVVRTAGPQGQFVLASLRAGLYELRASLQGFQASSRRIEIQVNTTVKVKLALQLEAMTKAVEATPETPMLEFANAQASTNVGAKVVTDLPSIN